MRTIPPNLAAHLADGATTLCHCWKLIRRDGAAFGFTDHDRDLAFGGTTFAARSGLEAAEATAELGFAVGGGEVAGALVSAGLTEDDIASGLYDDASVETWLVNWSNVDERRAPRHRLHRRDPPRRTAASWPRCAGSCTASTRSAGACSAPPARPISAMRNAASISASSTYTRHRHRHAHRRRARRIAASGIGFADGWCTGGKLTWIERRQCGPLRRDQGAPRDRRHGRVRPVAARAAADRGRRHVPRHGRLRQDPRHLPEEVRQRRRTSAASRTCPATTSSSACRSRASRGSTAGASSGDGRRRSRATASSPPRRAPGSARPTATRPRSRASAAIASACCAASGARSWARSPNCRRPIRPTGRRPAPIRSSRRRGSISSRSSVARFAAGDVLLFRWRDDLPGQALRHRDLARHHDPRP